MGSGREGRGRAERREGERRELTILLVLFGTAFFSPRFEEATRVGSEMIKTISASATPQA